MPTLWRFPLTIQVDFHVVPFDRRVVVTTEPWVNGSWSAVRPSPASLPPTTHHRGHKFVAKNDCLVLRIAVQLAEGKSRAWKMHYAKEQLTDGAS